MKKFFNNLIVVNVTHKLTTKML